MSMESSRAIRLLGAEEPVTPLRILKAGAQPDATDDLERPGGGRKVALAPYAIARLTLA